jgi:hypothetical protein
LGAGTGLPRAIAPHNSYWMWGPGDRAPTAVIAVGIDDETLDGLFVSHELAGVYRCRYCRKAGNGARIAIGREPLVPLQAAWKGLKHYKRQSWAARRCYRRSPGRHRRRRMHRSKARRT